MNNTFNEIISTGVFAIFFLYHNLDVHCRGRSRRWQFNFIEVLVILIQKIDSDGGIEVI